MREHQIVITLKPDQFLEVQRLARAANAKSMGIFVRQQLLSALGIDGTGNAGGGDQQTQAENLQAALGQIKRLHGELKTFVAESLSLYNVGVEGNAGEPARPVVVPKAAPVGDSLESVAERTFAISPRLGAIGQSEESGRNAARSLLSNETPVRHDSQRREQHRLHHAHHAAGDILDVPYKAPAEPSPSIDDPLHKLLGADEEFAAATMAAGRSDAAGDAGFGEVDQMQSFVSGGAADVPPSLAQRLSGAFYSVDEDAQLVPTSPSESDEDSSEFDADADLDDAGEADAEPEPKPNTSDSNKTPGVKKRTPPPFGQGQSSFSGSPPPKRRQV
jgi:hypothetical protein